MWFCGLLGSADKLFEIRWLLCRKTEDIQESEKSLTLILSASEVILQAAHLTTHPDVPFDYIIYSCFCTLS